MKNTSHSKKPVVVDEDLKEILFEFCFKDVDVSPEYYKEILCRWMHKKGIIKEHKGQWVWEEDEE